MEHLKPRYLNMTMHILIAAQMSTWLDHTVLIADLPKPSILARQGLGKRSMIAMGIWDVQKIARCEICDRSQIRNDLEIGI